jgi:CxxC motif-containing protein (DUF1111 family)
MSSGLAGHSLRVESLACEFSRQTFDPDGYSVRCLEHVQLCSPTKTLVESSLMTPRVPAWRPEVQPVLTWKRAFTVGAATLSAWYFGQIGLAWMRAPSAKDLVAGEKLFAHEWQPNDPLSAAGDGLGPVFNAKSCAACHFQGGIGGAGGLQHNVAAFEVLPTLDHPAPTGGVIHAFAAQTSWQESFDTVRQAFPIIPKGLTLTAICTQPLIKDYDPVIQHSINTPTLFGAGKIDQISGLAIRGKHIQRLASEIERDFAFDFKRGGVGRVRVLPDGRIGKFGWKAQFATLEEFVANACAVEVGLSTPSRKQHKPQAHREDLEAKPDLSQRQFTQLVAYVAKLPEPQLLLPKDPTEQSVVLRGRELFTKVECAACHTPDLGGAKGVYSDFCLHDLSDPNSSGYDLKPQVPVPDDYPKASEWKTPPLWGVAQTAPYMHDGGALTLLAAIQAHAGQARHVRDKFLALQEADRVAVLKFLESLSMP